MATTNTQRPAGHCCSRQLVQRCYCKAHLKDIYNKAYYDWRLEVFTLLFRGSPHSLLSLIVSGNSGSLIVFNTSRNGTSRIATRAKLGPRFSAAATVKPPADLPQTARRSGWVYCCWTKCRATARKSCKQNEGLQSLFNKVAGQECRT